MPLVRRTASALGLGVAAVVSTVVLAGPASATPNDDDRTWMVAAHQSNLAEIAAGKNALQRASSAEVRRIGQTLVTDHTRLDTQLTTYARQLDVTLPQTPTAQQQQELASVQAKSGSAYDMAWVASQIAGHRAILAATQKEMTSGSDENVLDLARAAAPVVQMHLTELQNASGSPGSVNGGTGGQAAAAPLALAHGLQGAGVVLLVSAGGALWWRRRLIAAR